MATYEGQELVIKIGDGGDPEAFTAPCGLNTRGFQRDAQTNEFEVIDCANPDDPMTIERVIKAFSTTVSGAGMLYSESIAAWDDFFTGGVAKNLEITVPGLANPFVGSFICTSLNISGGHKGKVEIDVTLESNGAVVQTS